MKKLNLNLRNNNIDYAFTIKDELSNINVLEVVY